MNRLSKQIIYGSFHLIILGAIGFGVYAIFFAPEPASCFDNIKNQNEVEVDCSANEGGKCITCELKNIKVLHGPITVLPLSKDAATLVLEISNPNLNYGLRRFDYTLDIYSKFGPVARYVRNHASLYPGEKKYIVESGVNINPDEIGKIDFTVLSAGGKLEWEKAAELGTAPSAEISSVVIRDEGFSKVVEGEIKYWSSERALSVIVSALGFDENGAIYRVGTAEFSGPELGKTYNFKIFLPKFNYKDIKVVANIIPE